MAADFGDAGPLLLALLGLLIGSFLNVLIHRLPKMMELQWAAEIAQASEQSVIPAAPFNLMVPRSACPRCGTAIAWSDNLPLLSYALLRGRCRHCEAPISLRYPLVELSNALLFGFCGWHWGLSMAAFAWCVLSAALLSLALIDWDTTLLPDAIVLPVLWLGLIGASMRWTGITLEAALWGAVAGYLALWSIFWAFKLVTGKEGMGYGDFKLLACLGAWFGWQALVPILLMSSVIGAVVGILLKIKGGLREGGVMPFGPFLVGAGLVTMFWDAAGLAPIIS
jgi:leader peptidase (prepilin peptidase)/N-methyltransferase